MMDTPHIGSKVQELICIDFDNIVITIKGNPSHPSTNIQNTEDISSLSIAADENFGVSLLGGNRESPVEKVVNVDNLSPLFYEQRNYEIVIEYSEGNTVEFWHENNHIRKSVTRTGKKNPSLSGVVNFRNEIGYSDLYIKLNGKEFAKITIEVFPSKIKYQSDYVALVKDITNEVYNLAFDFLKSTYQKADIIPRSGGSLTEFYSIIQILFDRMMLAVDIILEHPHHKLDTRRELVRADKVRYVDNKTIKWLSRHAGSLSRNAEGRIRTDRIETSRKRVTFDTLENRFVKHLLLSISNKLENLKKVYSSTTVYRKKRDEEISIVITNMQREVQKRINHTFIKDVGNFRSSNSMSLVFAMSPGYKELYRYYMMLLKGLSLSGSLFNISTKEMSELYEYWCFIKLNSFLKDKYKLVSQDIIKTDKGGLSVTLNKGSRSKVSYLNRINGEQFSLSYNQSYDTKNKQLPTLSQKPDNVLSLTKGKKKYEYIFDAKYKINEAAQGSDYFSKYKGPGPQEEDINTMHRYRDAIVCNNDDRESYERTMFGAYVLFPYSNQERYKEHHFFKSIDKMNIGALPFLPSATDLVRDFLQELINDSDLSAFERATLPAGIEEKLKRVDLGNRDVLIGMFRSSDQFDICFENKFYYTPVKNIDSNRFPIDYVGLHQSKNIFEEKSGISYYGKIKSITKVKHSEIPGLQGDVSKDGIYFYRIDVVEWIKLNDKIQIDGRFRNHIYYTNSSLLKTCTKTSELMMDSLDQFRLYYELNRLLDVDIVEDEAGKVTGFNFNDNVVYLKDHLIVVYTRDGKQVEYKLDKFKMKTKNIFNQIANVVNCE